MIRWKKEPEGTKPDWILRDENTKEIVASLTVLENGDGTYVVEVVSEKIGYTCRFSKLNVDKLKLMVPSLKKTVTYELSHFRDDIDKPTKRKVYDMIDDIPVWTHLKNGSTETKIKLIANDYGKFAEVLGRRVLYDRLERSGITSNLFPELKVIRTHIIKKFKVLKRAKVGLGDVVLEVDYERNNGKYGKKILVFEIKHGKVTIDQKQLRRYCSMIIHPNEHFNKADEVKVVYMMFDKIDTMKASAIYSMREMDKKFAIRVLEQIPVEKINIEVYKEFIEGMLPGVIKI